MSLGYRKSSAYSIAWTPGYYDGVKLANRYKRREKPLASSEAVSKSMRSNRGKDTAPELLLRRMLWASGIRGYRLHHKRVLGRPDLAFINKKIAVFINGCFWHRCPYCKLPLPKSNRSFWKEKFIRNQERDRRNVRKLRSQGWKVVTVWECRLKKSSTSILRKIVTITATGSPSK